MAITPFGRGKDTDQSTQSTSTASSPPSSGSSSSSAGAGGLTAAVALAQAGKSVTVFEQHYLPGGYSQSCGLHGYRFSPGIHYIGQLGPGEILRVAHETYSLEAFAPGLLAALRYATSAEGVVSGIGHAFS